MKPAQATYEVGFSERTHHVHRSIPRHLMEREELPESHRFCLPPGTVVEQWRLLGCHGHGAHGVVYRAVRVGQEAAGPVALKLARYPWDPRFMREVALLSLIHHPSVPRLLGLGFWKLPSGSAYPFVIMEWIEGTPLYEWAREHHPSSQQVLQVLAQLARALQATHASKAVHRDVKRDNVLVRRSDGRAVLTDFGTGNYHAAARVTWQPPPPGTPAYQSSEAGLFQLRSVRSRDARYLAGPADDVYALGVTAYRLVTGEYPPDPESEMADDGTWHMKEAPPPDPRKHNPQVDPLLSTLILRMLSLSPNARGTAEELADALEAAMGHSGRQGDEAGPPKHVLDAQEVTQADEAAPPKPEAPAEVSVLAERAEPRTRRPMWSSGLVLALAAVLLAFWTGLAVHMFSPKATVPDESPIDLGDLAPAVPLSPLPDPSETKAIGQDQPPKPFPGQIVPDAKGRCPGSKQVPINGGCWGEALASDAKDCEQNGFVPFKGRCYAPAMDTRRKPQPTSEPPP